MRSIDSNIRSNSDVSSEPVKKDERKIDWIFGSGTRVDVLWCFMQNPEEYLGSRDIERLSGRSQSDVRRNMLLLFSSGLIESRILQGNNGLKNSGSKYRLNKKHPWVPALRMLLERSIGSLKILEDSLGEMPGIKVAFVFGSFATSEQRPDSDIDLIVIGEQTLKTLSAPLYELEKKIGREINAITNTPVEWRSKFESGNHFVKSLMESPKIYLVGDAMKLEMITIGILNGIQNDIQR
jgi:uncharacterized protein